MRNLRAKTQGVAEPLGSAPCLVQHPEAARIRRPPAFLGCTSPTSTPVSRTLTLPLSTANDPYDDIGLTWIIRDHLPISKSLA